MPNHKSIIENVHFLKQFFISKNIFLKLIFNNNA